MAKESTKDKSAGDITARKQAEEALRESEEKFSKAFRSSPNAMVISTLKEGKFLEVNDAFLRKNGFSREEVIGHTSKELGIWVNPEDRVRILKIMREQGWVVDEEYKSRTKSGEILTMLFSAELIDIAGERCIISATADITESKRMEEKIQAEQNKLRSLIGAMEFALTIQDKDFNIIYQNKPSKLASGGDHIGEKCYRVFEGRETVCEGCPVKEAFKDGKSHTSERQRLEPSGEITFWETTARPIRDAKGNIVSGLEIGIDITERKKAEGALADEATQRRVLIDQSLDGIVILDEDARVVEANQKFAEMLGYTPEEVRELHTWDWDKNFPPEELLEMGRNVDETGLHLETRHHRKDGTIIDVEISINGAMCSGRKLIFCVCRDITAHKQAEEALRKSEEKFSKAFRSHPTAVALSTLKDGKFLEVNEAFLRNYGYSREEVIGHSSKELGLWVNPRDRVRILRIMREKGQVINEEFKARKKSGEIRTMTFSAEPIDIAGERCIIASTDDITERKRMDEAIRKSEERYRTIFESANDVIVLLDNKGQIVDVNPRIVDIGGYSRDQVIGKDFRTLTKIMPKKSVAILAKNFVLSMLGRDIPTFEVEMYRGDGTKLNVEVRSVVVKDRDKIVGVLANLRDVTERKKAESALRSQRELIDQIIATIPNAVLVIDKEMKILLANDTFYKHFKLKKAGVESQPIYDIIDEEELKLALTDTIENNKKGHYLEFRYQLKGVPRVFIATIVKMQANRYLVFLNDITEEREKQERLYLTDRLASVGEMASGVAHELNNPLTSIIGLSSLLAKESNMPAETKEDLEAINSEAQRCAAIVKNLLSFARKHAPKREPLSVTKVVEDVLKLRAYEHRSQNVTVETDLPDDLPHVEADYFQLQQVFLNIILNAETAMVDANGKGTLRIRGERTDGYVRLSFSDDGPGIAKKDLRLIFNPFFTTKEVGKGTGLGLSICYGIIAAHGGKIQAKNNSDKGATFVVELPIIGN